MNLVYFFYLFFYDSILILNEEKSVRAVRFLFQLKLPPLDLFVVLPQPLKNAAIIKMLPSFPIFSGFFVYLPWIFLPSRHLNRIFKWGYMLGFPLFVKISHLPLTSRPSIIHFAKICFITFPIYAKKGSIVEFSLF